MLANKLMWFMYCDLAGIPSVTAVTMKNGIFIAFTTGTEQGRRASRPRQR
jgi:hypothetical protein